MNKISTEDYINNHKNRVSKWIRHFSSILFNRSEEHDRSKLLEPEISLWKKMDEEPRYPYGTKEYKDKLKRHKHVFDLHYSKNRHHYEYFQIKYDNDKILIDLDIDLIDIIEMICDWLGYKDSISYSEASNLVKLQCERYGFSEELDQLILNTLRNHFVTFGNIKTINHPKKLDNSVNILI